MKLHLLYFARLREAVGTHAEELEVPPAVTTVAQLRAHLAARGGAWAEALAPARQIRAAIKDAAKSLNKGA